MKTSGLIKITSARDINSIVNYNTRHSKTLGQWKDQDQQLNQNQLVGVYGTMSCPGDLQTQINHFSNQVKRNALLSNLHRQQPVVLIPWPQKYSICHTVVQSFDYKANPNLTPIQVHKMGVEMLSGLQNYFHNQYHYTLDGGLISTHIDDDHEQLIKGKIHHTHLHNHIIIPSFNHNGKSISPYIRKRDIYSFQHINDNVTMLNNLNDYHFWKVSRLINPNSAYTKSRKVTKSKHSHLQLAVIRFTNANNSAFDKYPIDFKQAKHDRNHILEFKYNFRTRTKKDKKTHHVEKQFTMNNFLNSHTQQNQWYNLANLNLLLWKDKKEERCERLIRQMSFKYEDTRAVSYQTFTKIMEQATTHIPPLEKITSPNARNKYHIVVTVPKSHIKVQNHIVHIKPTWQGYLSQMKLDQQWKSIPQDGEFDFRVNFLNQDIQKNNHKFIVVSKNNGSHDFIYHHQKATHQLSKKQREQLQRQENDISR